MVVGKIYLILMKEISGSKNMKVFLRTKLKNVQIKVENVDMDLYLIKE